MYKCMECFKYVSTRHCPRCWGTHDDQVRHSPWLKFAYSLAQNKINKYLIPALPPISCVTLDKPPHLSGLALNFSRMGGKFSKFSLVIYLIHSNVCMSIPIHPTPPHWPGWYSGTLAGFAILHKLMCKFSFNFMSHGGQLYDNLLFTEAQIAFQEDAKSLSEWRS